MLVITDGDGAEGVSCVTVPSPKYPVNMPVTQFVPMSLLAGYLSAMLGEQYGRGCEGPWSFCENGFCVQNNEIVLK